MNSTNNMPVLPVEAYTSQEWFELEQKSIFSRTWQFAGFVEDLTAPGDYITVQAGLNNILIVYGEDRQLRAFHNLCRHRGTQLLRAVGKGKKFITCPYHDWTYTLEGELSAVPDRQSQFPDLDKKKLCLHKASVGIWRGIIFVHPDAQAESLSNWFGGVRGYLGPHQPEKLVEYKDSRSRHEINANWKIVVENYIDGYHLSHLHSETLFMYDHRQQKSGFVENHFYFYEPLAKDYLEGIEKNSPLPLIDHIPKNQIGAYVPMLFPNLGLAEAESTWSIFHVIPVAPDRTIVDIRTKLMPMSSWEYLALGWTSWNYFKSRQGNKYKTKDKSAPMASGDFIAEDIYVCEQQQKSLRSPYFSVGATAKDLEYAVYQYQRNVRAYMDN